MFEIVKCLREKSSPTASMSVETSKPEEVYTTNHWMSFIPKSSFCKGYFLDFDVMIQIFVNKSWLNLLYGPVCSG